MMQSLTNQYPYVSMSGNKWLQRACATGFIFFMLKGLLWIVAAVWLVY